MYRSLAEAVRDAEAVPVDDRDLDLVLAPQGVADDSNESRSAWIVVFAKKRRRAAESQC